jgi:predicted small lipoprotein YifL
MWVKKICLSRRFLSLWLIVFVLGFVLGCGKKGDPVPLRFIPPQVVSNLRAEKVEQGIKLHWSTAIADGTFKIFRSEQFPDEEICEGCPRDYNVVSELGSGDSKLLHEASSRNYSGLTSMW